MKRYIHKSLISLILILITIGGFNLFMDPFWCFENDHIYNSVQKGTNERQQKVNKLYFRSQEYDALLLGSSRTTYMNQHAFKGMNVYNLSASGMRPQEYLPYINFAVNDAKQPIHTIIIGMDFFGYLSYGLFMFDNAPSIVEATKSPYYRWKMLFSFDATNTSFKNIRDYLNPAKHTDRYDRDGVKMRVNTPASKQRHDQVLKDVIIYARTEYASEPNPQYGTILNAIKSEHPDKRFLIYTTPISEPLFKELIRKSHYTHYENWLRNLVSIYGEVHHFMYINSVSKHYLNYFADSNHAFPTTNELLAHKITMPSDPNIPEDFGMLITKENLEEKLRELRTLNGIQPSAENKEEYP